MAKRWVYFFADGTVRRGPYTLEQIREFPLQAETMVWREGMPQWSTLRDVPELWAIFAEQLVEPPPGVQQFQEAIEPVAGVVEPGPPQTPFFARPVQPLDYQTNPPLPPSGLAIASLITGIAGLLWWCLPGSVIVGAPTSIAALICGVKASRKARRREAGGAGMALSGLILGIVNLVISLVVILMIVVFFVATVNSQKASQKTSTPTTLPLQQR